MIKRMLIIGMTVTFIAAMGMAAMAETLPFDLSIKGKTFDVEKSLEISDIGEGKTEIAFDFEDSDGKVYSFSLNYKELPGNRSYPTNLDITIKDSEDNKLGYLFFAINRVKFLKKMGVFGLIIDINGDPVDIQFIFKKNKRGHLSIARLGRERFVQDTLVSNFNFQMIRPVILPRVGHDERSITYALDDHPYAVNYTILNLENGLVQFQHNLYQLEDDKKQLLERIYFNAANLKILREAMYAGKYFHKDDGVFKLVFYPAMGQTEPGK
ncbi:MAG: hypothetical protein GY754_40850 [bacterium]|nr:hypothetical protein [bacterium]